jgi:hypothetical protein
MKRRKALRLVAGLIQLITPTKFCFSSVGQMTMVMNYKREREVLYIEPHLEWELVRFSANISDEEIRRVTKEDPRERERERERSNSQLRLVPIFLLLHSKFNCEF